MKDPKGAQLNQGSQPVEDDYKLATLSPWVNQAKKHWKEFCPKMYAELEKSGLLHERAVKAAQQTQDDLLHLLLEDGFDHQAAWEAVRERYLFLPSEEDQPILSQDPDRPAPESSPETAIAWEGVSKLRIGPESSHDPSDATPSRVAHQTERRPKRRRKTPRFKS